MIPARFVFEYPERCLQLIEAMEPEARRLSLVGSFSLMVAPSLFLIPYERLSAKHPLREHEREPEIYQAIKRIGQQQWLRADFWSNSAADDWRLGRIVTPVNRTDDWKNERDLHPFRPEANVISDAKVDKVMRVVRNALAHGNVVYLDQNGFERRGARVQYLAFLSRYEEGEFNREHPETYRIVTVTEEGFLRFLKDWATWLQNFAMDQQIFEAA